MEEICRKAIAKIWSLSDRSDEAKRYHVFMLKLRGAPPRGFMKKDDLTKTEHDLLQAHYEASARDTAEWFRQHMQEPLFHADPETVPS